MSECIPDRPPVNIEPYAYSAQTYWDAGWRGVLPLPPGQKGVPPLGFTGRNHTYPSWPDVQCWLDESPASNIALRMPPDVLGIDVDAYDSKPGATSLATLEAEFGALPPTWTSTARQDGVSGIRFYRVPDRHWREKRAGPGIDLIQRAHRYAVVWPSTNPDADGARYVWIAPTGERGVGIPRLEDFPTLPAAWIKGLTESESDPLPPAESLLSQVESDPFTTPTRLFTAAEASAFVMPDYEAFKALRTPEDTGFNQKLNDLAVLTSHFVPEFMSTAAATAWLMDAAEHNGSVSHQGRHAVAATIASGLSAATWKASRAREHDAEGGSATPELPAPDAVDKLLTEMLDVNAVLSLPAPVPLIRDVLDLDSESWLISKAGGFKSFVWLDMAAHVALGWNWRGRPVTRGPVVAVVAEGSKSIGLRMQAWIKVYGERPEGLVILPRPVQVAAAGEWAVLVEACRRLKPVMVIFDTQARITVGLNENDNGDMGRLTEAVRRTKEATKACVLVVHHQGRSGDDARGASAIDGAQDTELKIIRPEGQGRNALTGTLVMDKQKDAAEDLEFEFEMRVVDLGVAPDGRQLSSLALEPLDQDPFAAAKRKPLADWVENLSENQSEVLVAMRAASDEAGATVSDVARWITDHRKLDNRPAMARTSLNSAIRDLKAKTLLVQKGQRFVLTELIEDEE